MLCFLAAYLDIWRLNHKIRHVLDIHGESWATITSILLNRLLPILTSRPSDWWKRLKRVIITAQRTLPLFPVAIDIVVVCERHTWGLWSTLLRRHVYFLTRRLTANQRQVFGRLRSQDQVSRYTVVIVQVRLLLHPIVEIGVRVALQLIIDCLQLVARVLIERRNLLLPPQYKLLPPVQIMIENVFDMSNFVVVVDELLWGLFLCIHRQIVYVSSGFSLQFVEQYYLAFLHLHCFFFQGLLDVELLSLLCVEIAIINSIGEDVGNVMKVTLIWGAATAATINTVSYRCRPRLITLLLLMQSKLRWIYFQRLEYNILAVTLLIGTVTRNAIEHVAKIMIKSKLFIEISD